MDCSHIRFSDRKSEVEPNKLKLLFEITAFWAKDRSLGDLAIAIANSEPVISCWDGERLIGCARATSDGIYRATIWDVVIHPEYQGVGLGRKLVETLLSHPHMNRVERIYLMTTYQQKFYQRIGFETNTTTTMVLHQNHSFTSEMATRETPVEASIEVG